MNEIAENLLRGINSCIIGSIGESCISGILKVAIKKYGNNMVYMHQNFNTKDPDDIVIVGGNKGTEYNTNVDISMKRCRYGHEIKHADSCIPISNTDLYSGYRIGKYIYRISMAKTRDRIQVFIDPCDMTVYAGNINNTIGRAAKLNGIVYFNMKDLYNDFRTSWLTVNRQGNIHKMMTIDMNKIPRKTFIDDIICNISYPKLLECYNEYMPSIALMSTFNKVKSVERAINMNYKDIIVNIENNRAAILILAATGLEDLDNNYDVAKSILKECGINIKFL